VTDASAPKSRSGSNVGRENDFRWLGGLICFPALSLLGHPKASGPKRAHVTFMSESGATGNGARARQTSFKYSFYRQNINVLVWDMQYEIAASDTREATADCGKLIYTICRHGANAQRVTRFRSLVVSSFQAHCTMCALLTRPFTLLH